MFLFYNTNRIELLAGWGHRCRLSILVRSAITSASFTEDYQLPPPPPPPPPPDEPPPPLPPLPPLLGEDLSEDVA
jgi:hypothetical protein